MEAQIRVLIDRLRRMSDCGCNYQCNCDELSAMDVVRMLEPLLPKESKLLTAAEARNRVEETIEGEAKQWLDRAEKAIERAVINKQYYVSLDYRSDIYSFVKKQLEAKGFKVEASSVGHAGGSYIRVAW